MKDQPTRVTVHYARYSRFDPDRWWETHDGTRIELEELEKLLLDIVRHPSREAPWPTQGDTLSPTPRPIISH
jgi:hypothetical protein